jgi:hypothetical protein
MLTTLFLLEIFRERKIFQDLLKDCFVKWAIYKFFALTVTMKKQRMKEKD